MLFKGWRRGVGGLLVAFAFQAGAAAAAAPDSARLGRAKDYIADEQWTRAIAELRTVRCRPEGEVARRSALLAGPQPEPVGRFGGGHHDDPSARARISRRACGSSLPARCGWTSRCTCSAATCSGGWPCRRRLRHRHRPRHRARHRYHPRLRHRLSWRRRPLPPCRHRLRRPAIVLCRRLRRRMSHRRSRHRQCLPPPGCPRSTAPTPTSASRRWTG